MILRNFGVTFLIPPSSWIALIDLLEVRKTQTTPNSTCYLDPVQACLQARSLQFFSSIQVADCHRNSKWTGCHRGRANRTHWWDTKVHEKRKSLAAPFCLAAMANSKGCVFSLRLPPLGGFSLFHLGYAFCQAALSWILALLYPPPNFLTKSGAMSS